jgi:hypothetical protein
MESVLKTETYKVYIAHSSVKDWSFLKSCDRTGYLRQDWSFAGLVSLHVATRVSRGMSRQRSRRRGDDGLGLKRNLHRKYVDNFRVADRTPPLVGSVIFTLPACLRARAHA